MRPQYDRLLCTRSPMSLRRSMVHEFSGSMRSPTSEGPFLQSAVSFAASVTPIQAAVIHLHLSTIKRGRIWLLHLSIKGAGQRLTTGANMTERTGKIVKRMHEMKVNGPTKNGQAKIHSTSMREAIAVDRMTSNKPG